MTRLLSTWERPPRDLRRPSVHLDNVALVPASELKTLNLWRERAQKLPPDAILVVIPRSNHRPQNVGRRIHSSLRERGRHSCIATVGSNI
jgi:hypothetical protein